MGSSGVGSSEDGWLFWSRGGDEVEGAIIPGSSIPKIVPAKKEQQLQIKIAAATIAIGIKRGPCRPGSHGT